MSQKCIYSGKGGNCQCQAFYCRARTEEDKLRKGPISPGIYDVSDARGDQKRKMGLLKANLNLRRFTYIFSLGLLSSWGPGGISQPVFPSPVSQIYFKGQVCISRAFCGFAAMPEGVWVYEAIMDDRDYKHGIFISDFVTLSQYRRKLDFSGSSDSIEFPCNAGDLGLTPGSGRSPGERHGNPLQYSCLKNSMDRGAWLATVHGVAKSRT